jgi:hypothetical protein
MQFFKGVLSYVCAIHGFIKNNAGKEIGDVAHQKAVLT